MDLQGRDWRVQMNADREGRGGSSEARVTVKQTQHGQKVFQVRLEPTQGWTPPNPPPLTV